MLCQEKKYDREYIQVYDDLYDYGKGQLENHLKPLKEYYYHNPHDFSITDADIMDKAMRHMER